MQYGNRNRNRSREEKNTQRKVITHERERAINLDPGKIPRVVGTTRTRLLRLPCATTRTKEVLVVCYKPWYKNISFLCHWSKLLPKGAKTTTASAQRSKNWSSTLISSLTRTLDWLRQYWNQAQRESKLEISFVFASLRTSTWGPMLVTQKKTEKKTQRKKWDGDMLGHWSNKVECRKNFS